MNIRSTTSVLMALCTADASAQSFGGFEGPLATELGVLVSDIAAGDIDADGNDDVIVTPLFGGIAKIALSNADGTYVVSDLSLPGDTGIGVEIDRFDDDEHLDCVVANFAFDQIDFFVGDGAGAMSLAVSSPLSFGTLAGLAAADINLDGAVDLIVCGAGMAVPCYNDGKGSFTEGTPIPATGDFRFPALADLDDNGYPDALLPDINGSTLFVAMNIDGAFAVPHEYTTSSRSVALGDVDADGDTDVMLPASNEVTVFHNRGDGVLQAPVSLPLDGTGMNIGAADIEGDGDLDIVVSTPFDAFVYLSDGEGGFDVSDPIPALDNPILLLLADVTGDRFADLVLGPDFNIIFDTYLNLSLGLPPAAFALVAPAPGATNLPLPEVANGWGGGATLTWERAAGLSVSYDVVIATDAELIDVIHTASVTDPHHQIPGNVLQAGTAYYWGVVATNPLGQIASTPASSKLVTMCPGDANGDGQMNILDFVTFQAQFQQGCDL